MAGVGGPRYVRPGGFPEVLRLYPPCSSRAFTSESRDPAATPHHCRSRGVTFTGTREQKIEFRSNLIN